MKGSMGRVQFLKLGGQRAFLDKVVSVMGSPSLRGLMQFGFRVNYSALKNYYNGFRLLPEQLFFDMCELSGIDKRSISFQIVKDTWGQVKGGKKSKKRKLKSR